MYHSIQVLIEPVQKKKITSAIINISNYKHTNDGNDVKN